MSNLSDGSHMSSQLLLAKLITNPRLAREATSKTDEFLAGLSIGKKQRLELIEFFKNHGVRFLASAELLVKKRLDDIVGAMQVGRRIFSYGSLQGYFESYLKKTTLDEYISKNPVAESILFCKYIISQENEDARKKILLEYDLTRNSVLQESMNAVISYDTQIQDTETVICTPVNQLKAVIHPSVKIKKFPAGTSLMVKGIIRSTTNDAKTLSSEKEILIFHKNWKKGGVTTLKVSPDTEKFIKILMGADSLGHAFNILKKKQGADINVLRPVVMQFMECGLCAFQSVGRTYV